MAEELLEINKEKSKNNQKIRKKIAFSFISCLMIEFYHRVDDKNRDEDDDFICLEYIFIRNKFKIKINKWLRRVMRFFLT